MPANDTKLVVRLPQADKRRIKGLAATQGLTLGQAILQAFEAWAEKLQSTGAPPLDPGRSARADYGKPGQAKGVSQLNAQKRGATPSTSSGQARSTSPGQAPRRQTTPRQGQRPPDGAPSTPGGGRVPNPQAPSLAWLHRVGGLDLNWSKCPAAEKVHEKSGNVWVARGTHVPSLPS